MNQPPDLTIIDGGKTDPFANPPIELTATHDPPPHALVELPLPKTASQTFEFLAVRAAERYATNPKETQWAMIAEVFQRLGEFTSAFPYATARHVKWGYATVLKRVHQAKDEVGPMVAWLDKIPALATDKAAAAPLLWHYIASCAGQYAASIPIPRGQPGAWEYMKGELTISCSNEEAYKLGQQRHFWATYQGRLLYVVGVLLQEMAGVPVPQMPVQTPAEAVAHPATPHDDDWQPASGSPERVVVMTKIDDEKGVRNEQPLQRIGGRWFHPDGSTYVYYTPTHFRPMSPVTS